MISRRGLLKFFAGGASIMAVPSTILVSASKVMADPLDAYTEAGKGPLTPVMDTVEVELPEDVKRHSYVNVCQQMPSASNMMQGVAGANLQSGDACFIARDGKFYPAQHNLEEGTEPVVLGFVMQKTREGHPTTIGAGLRFSYSSDIEPGQLYYLSSRTPGAITSTGIPGQVFLAVGLTDGRALLKSNF